MRTARALLCSFLLSATLCLFSPLHAQPAPGAPTGSAAAAAAPAPLSEGTRFASPQSAHPERPQDLAVASAAPALPPRHRLILNNLLVLRFNPVGLEDQMRFGYQGRLVDTAHPLLRDNFLFVGIAPRLNPAFVKIGPSIEFQPGFFFNLRFTAEYLRFFSTFGFLQSYGSALDNYSDKLLAACSSTDPMVLMKCAYVDPQGTSVLGASAPRNFAASGVHLIIEPTVQWKYGPILFRNKFAAEYWAMQTQPGDRVFYDVTLDTLVPKNGWVIGNDLDIIYVTNFRLAVGIRYTVVKALYTEANFRPNEDRAAEDNMLQRLGPMITYTFFDRGFTRFNKPTLLLITSFYLDHRYRAGQAASQVVPAVFANSSAIPYVILGFSFQSDFVNTQRIPPRKK